MHRNTSPLKNLYFNLYRTTFVFVVFSTDFLRIPVLFV